MEYINAIIHALEAAKIRAEWYKHENNPRYLIECRDWLSVAKIYSDTELNYNGVANDVPFQEAA